MAEQVWVTNSLGGHSTNNRLSQKLREQAQPMFVYRQFTSAKEGGDGQGDTVFFDKTMALDTQGGTLVETATIPSNLVKMVKGSMTITEYGNSVAFTEKLTTLAEFDMRNAYQKWLVNDQHRVLDSAVAAQFVTADFRAVATSTSSTVFTTNGTFTAAAAANISDSNVKDIVDYMKQKWIPKDGENYTSIVSINSQRGVYDQLQAIMQYAKPEFSYNSEIGRFYNTRFVEDNAYLSDAVGSGTQYGEAIFFGQDAVAEAVALPEEVRYQEDDFGRDKRLAWYALLGFHKMWDQSDDDLNSVGKGFERIIYVGSA